MSRQTTPSEMPIVLTGTVVPNGVTVDDATVEKRLEDYTKAVAYYQRFATVFFLENSKYPLEQRPEFRETDRLRVRRFQPSLHSELGKGYQEFEMLDAWVSSESSMPEKWLKITGRYCILNILTILDECRRNARADLIIDQIPRAGWARAYYFCVRTGFYGARLRELYAQCDDRTDTCIEKVLFNELKTVKKGQVRFFANQPLIQAVVGSSGLPFPTGRSQRISKQVLRGLNRLVDSKYLWYPKSR
jgi:hypothetical protein